MLSPAHKKAKVPDVVIGVPLKDKPSPSILAATDVTVPDVLELPAPISVLTSAADMPLFNVGVEPLLNIAGVPVSVTLAVLAVIALACADVIPVFALLVVIFDACVEVMPVFALLVVMFDA